MIRFDVAVIGGGLAGKQAAMEALSKNKRVALITTGYPLDRISYSDFISGGGILMLGDKVLGGVIENGAVTGITTEKVGSVIAENYVLATGKFYSGGLYAEMDKVIETVFGLDVWYDKNRENWFDADFRKDQPFLSFGLETDKAGHPYYNGVAVTNLTAVGGILKK